MEFDDGSGPALFAGGHFTMAGDVPTAHVAKWDGAAWSSPGDPIATHVFDLAVFDDGTGPALFGAMRCTGPRLESCDLLKWDGRNWSAVGLRTNNFVQALAVFDNGTGPRLYLGGGFRQVNGMATFPLIEWDGVLWRSVGFIVGNSIQALTVYDDGFGPALFAGGDFFAIDYAFSHGVARWDGHKWSPLSPGGLSTGVWALTGFDDGTGPALFAGGTFGSTFEGVISARMAKWSHPAPPCDP